MVMSLPFQWAPNWVQSTTGNPMHALRVVGRPSEPYSLRRVESKMVREPGRCTPPHQNGWNFSTSDPRSEDTKKGIPPKIRPIVGTVEEVHLTEFQPIPKHRDRFSGLGRLDFVGALAQVPSPCPR